MENTIRLKLNAYGDADCSHNSIDCLDTMIPADSTIHEIYYKIHAEVVIDRLHLLGEDYDIVKAMNPENLTDEDYEELRRLSISPDEIDEVEVYDEMENYPALSEMVTEAVKKLANRLTKPIFLPLSEVGGEDTIIEPAAEQDESEDYGEIDIDVDGVSVEAI